MVVDVTHYRSFRGNTEVDVNDTRINFYWILTQNKFDIKLKQHFSSTIFCYQIASNFSFSKNKREFVFAKFKTFDTLLEPVMKVHVHNSKSRQEPLVVGNNMKLTTGLSVIRLNTRLCCLT